MSNFTNISNDDKSTDDSQPDVSTEDEEQVDATDSSDTAESTEAGSPSEDKELQAHKDQVYEGMIKSQTDKVLTGQIKLEEISDMKIREKVAKRVDENISKIRKEQPMASEEVIAQNVIQTMELKKILEKAPEEKRDSVKKDYNSLKAISSHEEALSKVRSIYNILTDEEMKKRAFSVGQRFHGGGNAPKVKQKLDDHTQKYIDSLPTRWKPKS
jgi:hypothetical protein